METWFIGKWDGNGDATVTFDGARVVVIRFAGSMRFLCFRITADALGLGKFVDDRTRAYYDDEHQEPLDRVYVSEKPVDRFDCETIVSKYLQVSLSNKFLTSSLL